MIDKIIVTGCSYSTGMEMVDHLLDNPKKKNRRSCIWKWFKKNYSKESKGLSIKELDEISNQKFHTIEREHSWPALLEKKTGIPVVNLSVAGGSIGRALIEFSKYCQTNKNTNQTIAIHQLPEFGRFYMRFTDHRTNVLPNDFDKVGYSKKYFKKNIEKLKNNYKQIIKKDLSFNYIEKHYNLCLRRIKRISEINQIKSFFITPKNIDLENSIIKDFIDFTKQFRLGIQNHPVDPDFNQQLIDIIRSKLSV